MEAVLYFLAAAVISYVASLQLGPVNLRVIQCTVQHDKYYALRVGIGGSLPEIVYAGIALYITELLNPENFEGKWMPLITLPVFLFLAILNFRKKAKAQDINENTEELRKKGFWEGFVLAMLNPQLITFWLAVITFFKTKGWLVNSTLAQQSMFVLGAAAGAFVLQLTFIAVAGKYKDWITKKAGNSFNKIIGFLFLTLALVDTFRLIKNLL